MTLLITIFLVLVNIFNTITTNIPKAEGLTAIEAWVIGCVLFVFGALIGKKITEGSHQYTIHFILSGIIQPDLGLEPTTTDPEVLRVISARISQSSLHLLLFQGGLENVL